MLFRVDRLELAFKPKPWAFADERRAEIDAYFAELQREKPALWNGRVLLLHHQVVQRRRVSRRLSGNRLCELSPPGGLGAAAGGRARLLRRGGDRRGRRRRSCSASWAPHTFNAGADLFSSGTPDPDDIVDGEVDLDFSVRRELKEETGLDAAELAAGAGLDHAWSTAR